LFPFHDLLFYYSMSVHLVVYSNGEPFNTTKTLTMKTVHQHTTKKVIIHDYNLKKIKKDHGFVI